MGDTDLISLNIPEEDKTAISGAIQVLKDKLFPHLVSLTPDERMELPKMGDKTVSFVTKNFEYSGENPEMVPVYVDKAKLGTDVNGVIELRGYYLPLQQICDALSDSIMLAGSEAYVSALSIYNVVKDAAKRGVPGAQTIYEDLRSRFPGRPKKA